MKLSILLIALFIGCVFDSCCSSSDTDEPITPTGTVSQAEKTMETLWTTRPWNADMTNRTEALNELQNYADKCSSATFKNYLETTETVANSLETHDDLFICYRKSFDKVLSEIKITQVEQGTVVIWMLYNMGYVVKTPSGCFGIDLFHRYAEQLTPYLDFICITHNHQDHYSQRLIDKMVEEGKPVVSNYITPTSNYPYLTKEFSDDLVIGNFKLHTCLTDHNNDQLKMFVTSFRIDCGEDTGHFILMHSGDSNFKAEQFTVAGNVDVYIPRYAVNALTENNVIGTIIQPKYVLLSHILEMTHANVADSRWTVNLGLERASLINCEHTYMPMWGEKMIWKNGKFN